MFYSVRFVEIKGFNYIRFSPPNNTSYYKNGLEVKRVLDSGTIINYSYRDCVRLFHNEEGAAIIHSDGRKDFYYWGTRLNCKSQEQFEKLLKLKEFL